MMLIDACIGEGCEEIFARGLKFAACEKGRYSALIFN